MSEVTDEHDNVTKADTAPAVRLRDVDPKLFRPELVDKSERREGSGFLDKSTDTLAGPDTSELVIDLTGDDPSGPRLELQPVVIDLAEFESTDRVIDLAVNGSVHATQWPTTATPEAKTDPVESLKIHGRPARAAKRALDVVIGVPLLMLALPVIGACMLLISATSRGPALFRQERIGRARRPFKIMKLRTMRADAEQMLQTDPELARKHVECGFKLPAGEDPRITRVGRFLRKTSLDELPQLVHVVSGEMSLVGPRPLVKPEVARLYGTDADLFLSVKPGITGLWQVNGRSGIAGSRRAALEKRYLRHWSVKRDLGIILRTVPTVLTSRGAH